MRLFNSSNINIINVTGGAYNRNISLISRSLIRRDADALRRGFVWEGRATLSIAIPSRASRAAARILRVRQLTSIRVPVYVKRVCVNWTRAAVACVLPSCSNQSRQDSGEEPWAGAGVRHGRRRPWFGPWRRQSCGKSSTLLTRSRYTLFVYYLLCRIRANYIYTR